MKRVYTRFYMLFLLSVLASPLVFGQAQVSGTVKSSQGDPLPGVNVLVKGTATGTTTDTDGSFVINVPADATLTISFIGYATQEVAVGSRTRIAVVLE